MARANWRCGTEAQTARFAASLPRHGRGRCLGVPSPSDSRNSPTRRPARQPRHPGPPARPRVTTDSSTPRPPPARRERHAHREDRGRKPAGYAGALASLTKDQDRRRKRLTRDAIDGVLIDLLAFCRDVVAEQVAPGSDLVNADVATDIAAAAQTWTTESTLRRIDAIVECRRALDANAAPQLALERMMSGFLA